MNDKHGAAEDRIEPDEDHATTLAHAIMVKETVGETAALRWPDSWSAQGLFLVGSLRAKAVTTEEASCQNGLHPFSKSHPWEIFDVGRGKMSHPDHAQGKGQTEVSGSIVELT